MTFLKAGSTAGPGSRLPWLYLNYSDSFGICQKNIERETALLYQIIISKANCVVPALIKQEIENAITHHFVKECLTETNFAKHCKSREQIVFFYYLLREVNA